jgi:hypothetical protein
MQCRVPATPKSFKRIKAARVHGRLRADRVMYRLLYLDTSS